MKHYHYIFTGSGLASLMTVLEMIQSGKFEDKSILLIDQDLKKSNDRTWCFWDGDGIFQELIYKQWETALFKTESNAKNLNLKAFPYKMIRGLDFYNEAFSKIKQHPNIEFVQDTVIDFKELGNHCVVKTSTATFTCNQIFNSIYNSNILNQSKKFPLVHQHFVGWFVKTKEAVFNPEKATFMDFSVPQLGNTRFIYVLPFSENEALVEYTLFSKDLLSKPEYENAIIEYLKDLNVSDFEIIEKEYGNIPMTCFPFWSNNSKNILHIGSAGGWTKASTGFTFKNSVKKSKSLVAFLQQENDLRKFHSSSIFWWYDRLFIDILYRENELGKTIFSSLFENGETQLIFKFLDEETTFLEDLKVIWSCPKIPFIKALFRVVLKLK